MALVLTKISETSTKITLGWDPVDGAVGYRFQSAMQAPKWSHTWNPMQSQVTFSKSSWYRVEALGIEEAGVYPTVTPPPEPSPPITITQGGTYSGHWKTTTSTPAVKVTTTAPVIIENSIIESTATGPNDYLLASEGVAVNLTIRGCTLNGPDAFPNAGWGRAMRFQAYKSVIVENCTINRTGGIYFLQALTGSTAIVRRCKQFNGQSDRSSGTVRQFLQFNNIHNAVEVLAEWNQIINEPGKSRSEDIFSVFNTSNAVIRNNYVQGGYPWPLTDWHKGTGCLVSDVPAGFNNIAHDNQMVGVTNLLMGITGGHGNRIYNNTMVTDGRAPDGTALPAANNGVVCYDYYNNPAVFYDNKIYGNKIGAMRYNGGNPVRNDEWCPGAANNVPADNTFYYGNHSTPITKADEDAEWPIWLAKLQANGITIGA
jgi:hypothetical protein